MIAARIGVWAIFTVIGPPVAALALMAGLMGAGAMGAPPPESLESLTEGVGAGLLVALVAMVVSFFVGGVPALLTGVVAAWTSPHVRRDWKWIALCVLTGAALSELWLVAFGWMRDGASGSQEFGFMAALGGVAALLCALVTRTFRPRPKP